MISDAFYNGLAPEARSLPIVFHTRLAAEFQNLPRGM